ncbi:MAG: sugar phosphate isomerase/epimerase [Planctomycetes bacterium]|nr:sugar phosphate isomerase/epimerase [Planctomycetota bacterium]
MNPRILLALALLASSLSGALQAADAVRDDHAAEQLGWHLATKCYTFNKLTLVETLAITRRLGLRYIEINPGQRFSAEQPVNTDHKSTPELRAAIAQKLAEYGVTALGYGVVPLGKDTVADRAVFQYAKDLGIGVLVSEPGADAFATLDTLTAEFGIKVAIHDHPKPSPYWNPESVLAAIMGHSAAIGACADTGHWARSGLDPVACLKQLDGHVISAHFKDTDKIGQGARDVPLGTGKAGLAAMLGELKRQHFKGLLSLEYESGASGETLIAELQQCIANFDKAAGDLAK